MTTTLSTVPQPADPTAFTWPAGFGRIPDAPWTRAPVDQFGLGYDNVGNHGWYKNLEPTIAQVLAALSPGRVLVDFSAGTGILAKRLLAAIRHPVGILNVDASSKFLRVAVENLGGDDRAAFRLLSYLKPEKRLELIDEVVEAPMLAHGADIVTATNAIHLYYDLPETLTSWTRILRPGGLALICSANMRNPNCRPGDWIIDETVAKVNDIVAELVLREPAFEQYRPALEDPAAVAAHRRMREKVFVPVRPLEYYTDTFSDTGYEVLHVFDSTIYARVDEWCQLLETYHDGVLSWVGGSPKVEGIEPSAAALRDRLFLIRYALEKLFPGQESFPATWTYLTTRLR
jgi:ubiquinone/menaquinone biosynthesis C-methylase UbiE